MSGSSEERVSTVGDDARAARIYAARALVKQVGHQHPGVVELARLLSVAARVEPELLRAIRVELTPRLSAGTEADLWFSLLVQSRGHDGVCFLPEVAEVLREQLIGDPRRAHAWNLTCRYHESISPAIRLEEEVTWLALTAEDDPAAAIDELLNRALVALVRDRRPGIAAWAARALPRLPARARASNSAWMLGLAAGQHFRGPTPIIEGDAPEGIMDIDMREVVSGLHDVDLAVRFDDGVLELEASGPSAQWVIAIPDSNPRIVEVRWDSTAGTHIKVVTFTLGEGARVVGVDMPVRVRTMRGDIYELGEEGTEGQLTQVPELDELEQEHYEVKLVFVGPGGVGKTCLLRCLKSVEPEPSETMTYGLEIAREPLMLDHPTETGKSIRLNCWDFGGQAIYEITHQFFFSPRSIYLVLWTPRDGLARANEIVSEWIDLIRQRVGKTARVFVACTHAQSDKHSRDMDKEELRQKFGDVIVDFVEVDSFVPEGAKPGARFGVAELKRRIAEAASRMPELFPQHYRTARQEFIELARGDGSEAAGQAWMYYRDFAERSAAHGLNPEQTRTLARLMDVQGHIVYHDISLDTEKDDGNVVILKPEWLAKAIGHVLEDAPTREASGVLKHDRLSEVWSAEEIPTELFPYFLRLMETFDVSCRLDDKHSLVPQLVKRARPDLAWTPETPVSAGEHQLSLAFKFFEVPRGLVPITIVQTHRYKKDPTAHWQRGVFLDYDRHGTAFIELRGRELLLATRGAYPLHFLDLLADRVEMMLRDVWPGIKRDATDGYQILVPCCESIDGKPCPGRDDLETLRLDQADGVMQRRCEHCRKLRSVTRLLMGFGSPDYWSSERFDEVISSTWQSEDLSTEQLGKTAHLYRRVLRGLWTHRLDGPCLFSLIPEGRGLATETMRLTLWCEWADAPHPCVPIFSGMPGDYQIKLPRAWVTKWVPAISWMVKILKVAAPIGGAYGKAITDTLGLTDVKANIETMEKMVRTLPSGELDAGRRIDTRVGMPEQLDEADFRMFHDFLAEVLPSRSWGNLKRARYKGEFLWLCPKHFEEYEPGLPKM